MPKVIKRPTLKEAARLKFVGAKMANGGHAGILYSRNGAQHRHFVG
jgi:hypothetical protein